jgi:hypothetical protein
MAREQPLPPVAHRRFTYHALRINGEPESHFKRRAELTAALRWVPVHILLGKRN